MSVPAVQALAERYPDVEVVSVSLDTSEEPVRRFAARHDFKSRIALAGDSGVDVRYRVESIPSFFLVDREGNVVRIWQGYHASMGRDWAKEIDKLLGA